MLNHNIVNQPFEFVDINNNIINEGDSIRYKQIDGGLLPSNNYIEGIAVKGIDAFEYNTYFLKDKKNRLYYIQGHIVEKM